MDWRQLVDELCRSVPSGSVTTYAEVSIWGYGTPSYNHPVRSLLRGASNRGYHTLTNRVVRSDGSLADLPEGPGQQRRQLLGEGLPFTVDGRVDFDRIEPVELT